MNKHPFVFSFPRSGLHLTAKIIGWPLHVNFDGMSNPEYVREQVVKKSKEILFTHQTAQMLNTETLPLIITNCLPIFIIRDPKDALLSWYFLHTKESTHNPTDIQKEIRGFIMSSFMNVCNKVLLWKEHISGFRSYHSTGLVIRYENLINHYNAESKKISDYLSLPVSNQLPSLNQVEMSRKGLIGDYTNYLDNYSINIINDICQAEINYIDQYLI